MIMMIEGTNESSNHAAEVACIVAVMSAAKYNKRTLLIQLTDVAEENTENLLIGKKKAETEVKLGKYQLEDKGIDALIRRAVSSRLTEDGFDATCTQMLSYRHMLDVAGITKKEDFELNLSTKEIATILKNAKKVYNNVVILLNGKNTTIMQEVLELADVYITCFSQKPVVEEYNAFEGIRSLKVITDYDSASAYSAMVLKKQFKERKIYLIPHNSGYRDACISGTLLTYLLKNINNTHEDDNYFFAKHCVELIEGIMDKEDWSVELPDPVELQDDGWEAEETEKPLTKVSPEQFYVEEYEEKRGIFGFGKKKMKTRVVLDGTQKQPADDTKPECKKKRGASKSKGRLLSKKEMKQILEEELGSTPDMEQDEPMEDSYAAGEEDFNPEEYIAVGIATDELVAEMAAQELEEEFYDQEDEPVQEDQASERKKLFSDSWFCPACGAENVGKFCSECGAKQPKEEQPQEDAKEPDAGESNWICPECGAQNVGKFCSECGAKHEAVKMAAKKAPQQKKAQEAAPAEEDTLKHLEKQYMDEVERIDGSVVTLPTKGKTAKDKKEAERTDEKWVCPVCGELAKGRYCEECGYEVVAR